MNLVNPQIGSEIVSALLGGAQLDTIRAYSLVMQLGFVRLSANDGLPKEIWVSLSGKFSVEGEPSATGRGSSTEDFFGLRASTLGAAYLLIGKQVTAASVSDSGSLQIDIGGKHFRAEADNANLEEVWSVMSDSPEATSDHRWFVALDDSGALSARLPS
jgi:hypothetical protein